jgi:hypothetical protein
MLTGRASSWLQQPADGVPAPLIVSFLLLFWPHKEIDP